MTHCQGGSRSHQWRVWRMLGVSIVAAAAVLSSDTCAAAAAAKPASSCVACHTDAEKLKAEAAKVPTPPVSALQAGKG